MKRGKRVLLKDLVHQDKLQIQEYLHAIKFNQISNGVMLRFSNQDVDESIPLNKFKFKFKNLWEFIDQPHFVKVQFTIENISRNQIGKFLGKHESLINKIVSRRWPYNPNNSQSLIFNCKSNDNDSRVLKMFFKENKLKVIIIASIESFKNQWS